MVPDGPEGAMADILVGDRTVNPVAGTPANNTELTLVKLFPDMVTGVPEAALAGLNPVITGGGRNVNPGREPAPCEVTTTTFPLAPAPTLAVIVPEEITL